jgi:pilus assembly protein Flp/PilA
MIEETAELRRRQSGQGLVEYALILVLIAVLVLLLLATTGTAMSNLYSDITVALHTQAGL